MNIDSKATAFGGDVQAPLRSGDGPKMSAAFLLFRSPRRVARRDSVPDEFSDNREKAAARKRQTVQRVDGLDGEEERTWTRTCSMSSAILRYARSVACSMNLV
jgi:hypothetical protein